MTLGRSTTLGRRKKVAGHNGLDIRVQVHNVTGTKEHMDIRVQYAFLLPSYR